MISYHMVVSCNTSYHIISYNIISYHIILYHNYIKSYYIIYTISLPGSLRVAGAVAHLQKCTSKGM